MESLFPLGDLHVPSCEAAAKKPCLFGLFSNAPLGSLSCKQLSWLSAETVLEDGEVLLRRNSVSVGRMQTGDWAGNPDMFLQRQGVATSQRGST